MSAAASVKRRPAKPPAPRDQSVVGTYEALKRAQLLELMDATRWAVISTRLLPDLYRTTGGGAKAAVISAIEMHTAGRVLGPGGSNKLKIQPRNQKPREWSPNLTTSDLAKLTGYTKRQCLKATTWAVEQAFILRRGKTGEARVQYRVDYDAMRRAPNAADPEELAERFGSQTPESEPETPETGNNPKSEPAENKTDKEGGCRTPGPRPEIVLPGHPRELATISYTDPTSGEAVKWGTVVLETDHPVGCTATIAPSGQILVKVTQAAAGEEEPEPATRGKKERPPAPQPDEVDRLARGLRKLSLAVSHSMAADLAAKLPEGCAPEIACLVVQERVERPGAKPFNLSWLPLFFDKDVPEKWQSFTKKKPASAGAKGSGSGEDSAIARAMKRRLGVPNG